MKIKKKTLSIDASLLLGQAMRYFNGVLDVAREVSTGEIHNADYVQSFLMDRLKTVEDLLAVVEVAHCGSVGGFDKQQEKWRRECTHAVSGIENRLNHLIGIYGMSKDKDT